MMSKLGKRGTAALEFCLVAAPIFILMFAIFDFARYAMTQQSLRMLADAGARAMMVNCYNGKMIAGLNPNVCTGDPLPATSAKQAVAPFLFLGSGGTVNLTVVCAGGCNANHGALNVTASQPGFTMVMPIWGTALNGPTAMTAVPF